MIHFINGKPGGGKSLYGTMQLIQELRVSDRFITTNLRINLEELEIYMQREFGENNFKTEGEPWTARVRLLSDVESKHFWLFPAPGYDLTNRVQQGEKDSKGVHEVDVPDWNQHAGIAERGTLYIIDEVHDHFNAREWQKSSKDGIYWASKHRHLRQDALLITQHPELVDKNFRRLAQDFTTLRNFGNEPLLGFRFASRFRRATYINEKKPGDTQPAVEKGWFKLDTKIAACYFTHGTTGILSRVEVKESKGRGRSPWWLVVWGLALVAVMYFAPGYITGGLGAGFKWMLGQGKEKTQQFMTDEQASNVVATISQPLPGMPAATSPLMSAPVAVAVPTVHTNLLDGNKILKMSIARNGFVVITLTNGVQVTSADGITIVGRDGFRYQGRLYPMP